STVPLTDPAINSMVPNCVGTVHGINVSASAVGPAACGSSSLSYSWTGPNSFSATTANITVADNVASIGSYTVTITDGFGCETDNSLTLDSSNCFTAPVPVSLVSFDGIRVKQVNKLFWTTATEINNSHFEVQRKIGNGTFEFLGRVDTKAPGGNSTGILNYTFNDYDMHQPGVDVFYMLKQVDFDNTVEFFGPVRISTDEVNEVTVYPNPANNVVNVAGLSNEFTYKVTVSDMLGKSIINSEIDAQNAKVDVSTLGNGVYNVLVTDENGIQSSTKVVISH
ncbi:MAG: T9SS type A sorting domain-containing protein, partial [Gammaproteobacteria bacterium]|nr:T9SS type A sorting domain-containing protein [Gammaproteobacteria bacterium]